jgi:sulfide dehydrogenase cytochrome subunit
MKTLVMSLLLLSAGAAAQAQDAKALQAASLAGSCTACHGTQGRAVQGSTLPSLAGMPANYIAEQLKGFKSGSRPATVMHQIAKGYSDAQIEQLAAYFAAQKK